MVVWKEEDEIDGLKISVADVHEDETKDEGM